jgi:hypothetical protein
LKKRIRGVRPIERELEGREDEDAVAVRRGSQRDYRRRPAAAGRCGAEAARAIDAHLPQPPPRGRKKGLPRELEKLKKLVDRGLDETAAYWPSVQRAFSWVHQAAKILANHEQTPAAHRPAGSDVT